MGEGGWDCQGKEPIRSSVFGTRPATLSLKVTEGQQGLVGCSAGPTAGPTACRQEGTCQQAQNRFIKLNSRCEVSSPVTQTTCGGIERQTPIFRGWMFSVVEDRMVGWRRTCLNPRCLGYTTILVQILDFLLLFYSLIIEGGNIYVNGCKKIGFYNYCARNTTTGDDCHCFTQFEDLHLAGISVPHGLTVSLILTYSSLVFVAMGLACLPLAQWLKEDVLWKFQLGLNVFSLVGLVLGTGTHLFLTWDQFDLSHVTLGFLTLLLAISGLSLQSCLISWYIRLNNVLSTCKTGGHAPEDLSFLVA